MIIVKLMLGLSHLIGQILIVSMMLVGTTGILIWGFLVSFRFHLLMGGLIAVVIYQLSEVL